MPSEISISPGGTEAKDDHRALRVCNYSADTYTLVWREVHINLQTSSFSQCSVTHKENKQKTQRAQKNQAFSIVWKARY